MQRLLPGLLLAFSLMACRPQPPDDKTPPPTGNTTTVEGQLVVPPDFLGTLALGELMDSATVWLVDAEGQFVRSVTPDAAGDFRLEEVPAGVAGQRLVALFGSGQDAVSLESSLGVLSPSSEQLPAVSVVITLGSTVQSELVRDPVLSARLREEVRASLAPAHREQLRAFSLPDLSEGVDMVAFVGDTSSLAAGGTSGSALTTSSLSVSAQETECTWWNPLTWGSCVGTPDVQVRNAGGTAHTVRRPAPPPNHALGVRFHNPTSAELIAAGGGNLIAAGGGNLITAGGGNLIAAGGGNLIAAGGGNLIAAGGGNALPDSPSALGVKPSASGDGVARRSVGFGYVLAEGEVGELQRFGARLHSPFVLVPKTLFDKYTPEEVAFIAKNISWAGERGQEAAERIIASMRARAELAQPVQERYRRAAEAPRITLSAEAQQHASPPVVYLKTEAGQEALAAPLILRAEVPEADGTVVEVTARGVTDGMLAYWRLADGSYESKPLTAVGTDVYRAPLSSAESALLLIATPGPTAPFSNAVLVHRGSGGVSKPGVSVRGLESLGGQVSMVGGVQDAFEDGAGNLFVAHDTQSRRPAVLRLAADGSGWSYLSQGLPTGTLHALRASKDGTLFAIINRVEGGMQRFRLDAAGVWQPASTHFTDANLYPAILTPEGEAYGFDSDDYYNTSSVYHLDAAGTWALAMSTDYEVRVQRALRASSGTLYLMAYVVDTGSVVLRYTPGDSNFTTVFSGTSLDVRPVDIALDPSDTLYVTAVHEPTNEGRIYVRNAGETSFSQLNYTPPSADFQPGELLRPRSDGPLYVPHGGRLYRLDPGSTTWQDITPPQATGGDFFPKEVAAVRGLPSGGLLALVDFRLLRQRNPTAAWEELDLGLQPGGAGAPVGFAGTELVSVNTSGAPTVRDPESAVWQQAPLPADVNSSSSSARVFFDTANTRAYALDEAGLYERTAGGWTRKAAPPISIMEGATNELAFSPGGEIYALITQYTDTGENNGQVLLLSSDGSWSPVGNVLPGIAPRSIAVSPGGALYLGTSRSVYRLEVSTGNWAEVGTDLSQGNNGDGVRRLFFVPGGALIAMHREYGVFRLNADGQGWTSINHNLLQAFSQTYIEDMVMDATGALFVARSYNLVDTQWGVFRLEPGGTSWTQVPGTEVLSTQHLSIGPDNRLYIMTMWAGLFRGVP